MRRRPSERVGPLGLSDAVQREHDKAYAEIAQLQDLLTATRKHLQEEQAERERLAKLQKARAAGSALELARTAVALHRRLRGRLRAHRRSVIAPPNSFRTQIEALSEQRFDSQVALAPNCEVNTPPTSADKQSLLLHHRRDEAVFDASLYQRQVVRNRLQAGDAVANFFASFH